MKKGVLCFLKRDGQFLLLKTNYGEKTMWNGVSGFIENDESAEAGAIREMREEIDVSVVAEDLERKGDYLVPPDLHLEIFIVHQWTGAPTSKEKSIEELRWFNLDQFPYSEMHPGNEKWLPQLLR